MKDELISFETAKLTDEKIFRGEFRGECNWMYTEYGKLQCMISASSYQIENMYKWFWAPTQSFLQRWLREQHMIYVSVDPETIGSDEWEWSYKIQHLPKEHWEAKRRCGHFVYKSSYNESPGGTYWGAWGTYEEALEVGLKEGLSLISGDNSKQ